jgi:L-rhamnose mutarotase
MNRPMNKRYYLALDLKDDPTLIAEYRRHHEKIWPEITESIKQSGVVEMEIYLLGTRMLMVMVKAQADRDNPKVREWEELMWKFQKVLPNSKPGEKWRLMERIFKLEK